MVKRVAFRVEDAAAPVVVAVLVPSPKEARWERAVHGYPAQTTKPHIASESPVVELSGAVGARVASPAVVAQHGVRSFSSPKINA
jgi:hypothetical protein